jgi:hypothetical protein
MRWVDPDSVPAPVTRPKTAATPSKQPARVSTWDPDMPAPDLAMLTGSFETPEPESDGGADDDAAYDEFDLTGYITEPEPSSAIPADAPQSTNEHDAPASTFSLDLEDTDAESAPAPEDESAPESDSLHDEEPESEEPTMSASPAPSTADDTSSPPDAIELLRVWRDISDGSLILEINGQRFTSLSDVRSADLERRFMNVVRDLVALVKAGKGAPPSSTRVTQEARPAARPAARPTPEPVHRTDSEATTLPKLSTDEMPSMAPSDMFRQMSQIALGRKPETPEEEPAPEPLSIPEQINALLQQRLRTMPEFADREIEVQPSLGGMVIIKVDGQFFEGVGEVADDDVRALLQEVVREWENSQ